MPLPSEPRAGRSGRPGRIGRRAGLVAAVAAGVVLLLVLAAYAGWPWLAAAVAPRLAPALGLDALAVASHRPGLGGLWVSRIQARRGSVDVVAEGVRLSFHAAGLLAGRLDVLAVDALTVTLLDRTGAGAGRATVGLPEDPPQPAELLAVVPADRASVETLVLVVPSVEFRAAGRLGLDEAGLGVELTAEAPERARGLALHAAVAWDGLIDVALVEGGAGTGEAAAERLSLASRLRDRDDGAARLDVRGRLDLRGMVLALVTAAGLPDGIERIRGDFDASLPWPVPADFDWSLPTGSGTVDVAGGPGGAAWQLDGAEAEWRIDGGRLAGTVRAPVQAGSRRWMATLDVVEWRLAGPGGAKPGVARAGGETSPAIGNSGRGAVTVRLADTGPVVLRADWRADPAGLAADGALELSPQVAGALLEAFDVDGPAGRGELRLEFRGRLAAPVTDPGISVDAAVSGHWGLPAPGPELRDIEGRWRLDGRRLSGDLAATAGWREFATRVVATVTAATLSDHGPVARGSLAIGGTAPLDFALVDDPQGPRLRLDGGIDVGPALLDGALTGWTTEADLTAGRVDLDLDLRWPDPMAAGSRITVGLYDVSAYYGEYVLDGLSAELRLRAGAEGWRLLPAPVAVDRFATGVPLRQVRSGVAWFGDAVQVQPTTFELLGGSAAVPAFDYDLTAGRAGFAMSLEDLDLARILALEGEQISGTGRIGGTLPVSIDGHRPSVSGGMVRAAPPGGRLQVSPTLAGGTGQPGLDFALRALQDFRYEVLEAGVDYDADGNLALAVRLEGRNPGIEGGRPIHYNVNVSENIPVLLRSLRLESEVTRSLERRLNN